MPSRADPYTRTHPSGVSLRHATDDIPSDGRWHLFKDDTEIGHFGSLGAAMRAYLAAVESSGWIPPARERPTVDVAELAAQEAAARAEEFWSQAHNFRRRGGKGRL